MAARFLNTDVNLKARFDLKPLCNELEKLGFHSTGDPIRRGSEWTAVLEHDYSCKQGEPAKLTEHILRSVESLEGEFREIWNRCLSRSFDMGFDFDGETFSSTFVVKPEHLERISAAGMSLMVTMYRNSEEDRQNAIHTEDEVTV